MADLQSDIARIAAQRGRDANYYAQPARRPLNPAFIAMIFMPSQDWRADLAAYDCLPEESRRYLQDATLPLNAMAYDAALTTSDEPELITTLQAHMPGQVKAFLSRHYARHPNARSLP